MSVTRAVTIPALYCRICQIRCDLRTCKRLFTPAGIRDRWACRLTEVLEVPTSRGDGLPAQICSSCSIKIRTIEDALQCLKNMVASIKKTTECFRGQSATMKRVKDTSGLEVSPHTARSRPAAKRATPLAPRQLNFGNNLSTDGTFVLQLAWCSSLSRLFLFIAIISNCAVREEPSDTWTEDSEPSTTPHSEIITLAGTGKGPFLAQDTLFSCFF